MTTEEFRQGIERLAREGEASEDRLLQSSAVVLFTLLSDFVAGDLSDLMQICANHSSRTIDRLTKKRAALFN